MYMYFYFSAFNILFTLKEIFKDMRKNLLYLPRIHRFGCCLHFQMQICAPGDGVFLFADFLQHFGCAAELMINYFSFYHSGNIYFIFILKDILVISE